uniref:Centromere protein J C-terminal domain-containing protein n=1 Tax=Aplanochytrium stocchinoi TaxID=215587 RepID=A0A7S3PLA6_9STRA|mmetsp:Transcript_36049/g.44796  ORF Transcript_36049/g.44796 Transcript_36049/m.44796 type:complete len:436 (+) Transcript_36049:1928-3235(+)|eukprot:CAMPEP_0204825426 /NCGR_PEP_ID=MMETSP1346-20131115/3323_1 /ASSEMBLY_ACC=CAM_ASM_000771 /TAXON_ID=215587 /ORGANISM="Aplanochytrium stocchinoi, Strain GSBS06" /LENGTH=435 /DNA_ID=CAMNT_0051953061 /DNA_START=337 /DNA_END=1644 /DNA_ORIENTATION=-
MFFDIHGNSDSDCDDDFASVVEPYSIVGKSVLVPIKKTSSEKTSLRKLETDDKEKENVAANKNKQIKMIDVTNVNEQVNESNQIQNETHKMVANEVPVSGLVKRMFATLDPKANAKDPKANTNTIIAGSKSYNNDMEEMRMKDLEREIEKFKQISFQLEKEKDKVSQSLAKISKMQEQSARQQNEFNKTYKSKREEFEEWKNSEREKLEKEKITIERQKRRIQSLQTDTMADRKDRSDIESLKASVAKIKLEKREYTNRMKGILQHKETRIKDLEQHVLELEETLSFAEQRRIDAWDKESEMKQILQQKEATITKMQQQLTQYIQQQQKKTDTCNKQTQTQFTNGDSEKDDVFISNNKQKVEKSDIKVKVFQDGHKLLKYPNGSTKEIFNDYSITRYINGDIEKVTKVANGENKIEYFYKKENTTVITYNILKKT